MKLVASAVEPLDMGDRISISVTHQIRINGDDSWVKYEASTKRRESETTEETDNRLLSHVDAFVIQACERVAKTVEEYQ